MTTGKQGNADDEQAVQAARNRIDGLLESTLADLIEAWINDYNDGPLIAARSEAFTAALDRYGDLRAAIARRDAWESGTCASSLNYQADERLECAERETWSYEKLVDDGKGGSTVEVVKDAPFGRKDWCERCTRLAEAEAQVAALKAL